jgi:hypothetical protein
MPLQGQVIPERSSRRDDETLYCTRKQTELPEIEIRLAVLACECCHQLHRNNSACAKNAFVEALQE